jgi:hypothetical protein
MGRKLLTFCLLALAAACGASRDKLLQSRADEVRKLLEESKRNPVAAGEYIIEGYASDLAKPAVTVTASVDPKLVPDWASAGPTGGNQAAGQPGKDTTQAPVIVSVKPQWIISGSERKLEITLLGQNLSHEAPVLSRNPQTRVDGDPVRTLVIAFMDPSAPPGDHELEYQAPAGTRIPFTIRYAKP